MRATLLAVALCCCVAASADVTPQADENVVISRVHAQQLLDRLVEAEAEKVQYDRDRATAMKMLREMQDQIKELESRKCI